MDPEPASDVVRRRHDTASARVAAHDERLRPQLGLLELLDRGEERVEVEVGNDHPLNDSEPYGGATFPA
jgi:hypothetical protein